MIPKKRTFEIRLNSGTNTVNLLDFLEKRFTYLNRQSWQNEISGGNIKVNNLDTVDTSILNPGDLITYTPKNFYEPEVNTKYKIIYHSDDLMIIDKPGNLPVHPAGRYKENTLLSLIRAQFPNLDFYPSHRLDRETSGVQIFALNSDKASKVQALFEKQMVTKEYIVYVHGRIDSEFLCEGYLDGDKDSPVRKKRKFSLHGDGEFCSTLFIPKENSQNITKLRAIPKTGRLHQIRATLKSLGYPVIGDKLYGTDDTRFLKFLEGIEFTEFGLKRQALHASKITFYDEVRGRIEISSPEPDDMVGIFKEAEK